MMKVMTIVGTRPEIIRLSRVIDKLDRYCNHILVHTGQNYDYELNEVFFKELDIRAPDHFFDSAGSNASDTISKVIAGADRILEKHKPDALLILGDTNSALSAIPAKRHKVPIFHMEAGNRCFDFRVPEEINRRIVDHVADINLPYSELGRENLLREGFPPDQIVKTGSPMYEVINSYLPRIESSRILEQLRLKKEHYFVVSSHREENVDSPRNLERLFQIISALAQLGEGPVVVSTHPRMRKRLDELALDAQPNVHFYKPFGFPDYIKLQTSARAVLSDSGTLTEESSILNFPALNLREVHERPEGFEEGAVMFVGLSTESVLRALDVLRDQPRGQDRMLRIVADYETANVSDKILRIILSYTDFVNRRVWHKA
jgi:UDP-N-acetylglucosamine 2-epimerase (non-hydrolysing)